MSRAREGSALDPALARRVASLTVQARRAVEGLMAGMHRSPHRGASVVFVDHREYRPGDDPRQLDWRAYARSDRHQIKRFEQESQLRVALVLDRSGSMAYGGEGRPTKAEYAAQILAALAYLLSRQGDAAGLSVFDTEVRATLPPRSRGGQLEAILELLAVRAEEGPETDLRAALLAIAERAGRRGMVAIASDLLDLHDDALSPLAQLIGRGHEVIVWQVLDPDELELPFEDASRFRGLEGEGEIEADPEALRAAYLEEVHRFLARTRAACSSVGARHVLARTDEPVERALAAGLSRDGRRRR